MLVFWCMAALAALLLYWKLQTVAERQKSRKAEKAAKTPKLENTCPCKTNRETE